MEKIIIAHQHYCPSHFLALYKSEKFDVTYKVLDPIYYLYMIMRGRGGKLKNFLYFFEAIKNVFVLNFISGSKVIFALPPYHLLLFLYIPFIRNNRTIYFTSWPFWEDNGKKVAGVSGFSSLWKRTIERYAQGVACVNSAGYRYWKEKIPSELVEHSVETSRYIGKNEYGMSNRIIYIGRPSSYKNTEKIVAAVTSIEGMHLDILGPFSESKINAKSKNVKLLGQRSKEWIYENLCKYDALILASDWKEPYGIVLLEAMAVGLPVLVTLTAGSDTIFKVSKGDGQYRFMICKYNKNSIRDLLCDFSNTGTDERKEIGRLLANMSKKYLPANIFEKWNKLLMGAQSRT